MRRVGVERKVGRRYVIIAVSIHGTPTSRGMGHQMPIQHHGPTRRRPERALLREDSGRIGLIAEGAGLGRQRYGAHETPAVISERGMVEWGDH